MSNPTVTAALVTGGTLPIGPSQASATPLGVIFGLSPVTRGNYTITLINTAGQAVASAQARLRSPLSGTCGNDQSVYPSMPLISASAGRVYYLDGDTDVRYLTPDGSTGLATRVPGSSQSVAMFAVSPDDRRIAVSVFDYRSHPVAARLYTENLSGGGNHVELPPSGVQYRIPMGWHAGNLVVGSVTTSPAYPRFGFYSPLPAFIGYLQLFDPATGVELATFGGYCSPDTSLPSAGGIACLTTSQGVGVIDWSTKQTVFATGDVFTGGASVSPDGSQVAASGTGADVKLISSPAIGSAVIDLGVRGYPADGGWIDSGHVVMRGAGTGNQFIVDVKTKAITPLASGAVLATRLPGGW